MWNLHENEENVPPTAGHDKPPRKGKSGQSEFAPGYSRTAKGPGGKQRMHHFQPPPSPYPTTATALRAALAQLPPPSRAQVSASLPRDVMSHISRFSDDMGFLQHGNEPLNRNRNPYEYHIGENERQPGMGAYTPMSTWDSTDHDSELGTKTQHTHHKPSTTGVKKRGTKRVKSKSTPIVTHKDVQKWDMKMGGGPARHPDDVDIDEYSRRAWGPGGWVNHGSWRGGGSSSSRISRSGDESLLPLNH